MRPPPDALGRFDSRETRPRTLGRRDRVYTRYKARRLYMVQCSACLAVSSARYTRRGVWIVPGFPVFNGRHTSCDAALRVWDISPEDECPDAE